MHLLFYEIKRGEIKNYNYFLKMNKLIAFLRFYKIIYTKKELMKVNVLITNRPQVGVQID